MWLEQVLWGLLDMQDYGQSGSNSAVIAPWKSILTTNGRTHESPIFFSSYLKNEQNKFFARRIPLKLKQYLPTTKKAQNKTTVKFDAIKYNMYNEIAFICAI